MAHIHRTGVRLRIPTDLSVTEGILLDEPVPIPGDKVIYEEAYTGRASTYDQFRAQVRDAAAWLHGEMGVRAGDTVTVISSSCIDYVVAVHAIWWVGGVVSLINDSLAPPEIAYALDVVQPTFAILGDSVLDKFPQCLRFCGWTPPASALMTIGTTAQPQWPSLSKAVTTAQHLPRVPAYSLKGADNRQVTAAILLSSGTTGHPKAVMLSHHNLLAANYQLRKDNPESWRQTMREVFFPPLSHIYAMYVVMTGATWLGYYVCMMPRFDIGTFCRLLSEKQCTVTRIVPPVAKKLVESPITKQYKYPALEYISCSAAPLTEKLAKDLKDAFPGVALSQTYGCTEVSGACIQSGRRNIDIPLNGTGTLIANMDMRFLDPSGNDVLPKGPGEIVVRGPNVMLGYLRNPKANREAFLDGGWYKTGDVGYFDDKGYLVVSGRTKDTIKYNGFQVSPVELENILANHPLVEDSAVCGIWSDEHHTDMLRAYIVPSKKVTEGGYDLEELARSISDWLSGQVSSYKQLKGGIVFVEGLPKSPTGKLLRRLLTAERDRFASHPILAARL